MLGNKAVTGKECKMVLTLLLGLQCTTSCNAVQQVRGFQYKREALVMLLGCIADS